MTMVEPLPGETAPPGYRVSVQVPVGRSVSSTLPVARMQLGGVIVPTTGAVGVAGCTFITAFTDDGDTHPVEFVTVNV